MTEALDDRAAAVPGPAAAWPAEDGSSYAVHPRRNRWVLPVLLGVAGLLLAVAAALLIIPA